MKTPAHLHHEASDIAPRLLRGIVTACLSLVVVLAIVSVARAGPFDMETKLTASDAAEGDYFGASVAISGNTAIVGATFDDDAGLSSGSAYLFDVTSGSERLKLAASDAAEEDWFGRGVGISEGTAIVGARYNDDAGSRSGSAYLFTSASLPSDLTGNGFVDADDLFVLLNHWDEVDAGAELGDLFVDPAKPGVNADDLFVLLGEWTGPDPNPPVIAALGAAAVPEPSSLLLAVLATFGLCVRRRRS